MSSDRTLLTILHVSLACTQTLFYFSFRSFRNIGEKKYSIFFSPHLYYLVLVVNKSPAVFIFYHPVYHARSTDFEEKMEGL